MKILLFLLISIGSYAQCDQSGFQFSTNLKGLTFDISHIAQNPARVTRSGKVKQSRIGFGFGAYIYRVVEDTGKEKNYYFTGDMHMHITYLLFRQYGKWSLHALTGGVLDLEEFIYAYGGLEFRIPKKTKQFFLRAQYPKRINLGIIIMP